jgi:hypothetical protein
VFNCVDGVFIFFFCISLIFISLGNNLVLTNPRSKEINLHNKIFHHNTRFVVTNYSGGISIIVYKLEIYNQLPRKLHIVFNINHATRTISTPKWPHIIVHPILGP